MKATGTIRRIDDLGRVVIPKEIRRKMRICEGDPIEIFINCEGEVVLKKYSPIGELGNLAKKYAASLCEATGHISMITDRDMIIAVAGANKLEFLTKAIGPAVERVLEERGTLVMNDLPDNESVHVVQSDEHAIKAQVITPIIAQGDPIGAVIIASKEAEIKLGDMEVKLAETAAGFLAKQMEV